MPPIPQTIPAVPELAIASFPATEIASGTGTQLYYPLMGKDDSGDTFNLSESSTFGSWTIETRFQAIETQTLTFDSAVFNLPRYVKGTGIFKVNMKSANAGDSVKVSAQLQRWDGSNATNLTAEITSALITVIEERVVYLTLPITTEKMIRKGDQVRLVVKLTKGDSGGTATWGHSPTNQTSPSGTITNTQMIIGVPFRSGS